MDTLSAIEALRERARRWRRAGERVVLVPTMGNLHRGHLALVQAARPLGDRIVVSLFVNPLQFGPGEDFDAYPRTINDDIAKLSNLPVDVVFAPGANEIYPRPIADTTRVVVPELSDILCGASRPGHFEGVATMVSILFHLAQPDVAVFGEKDYQQLLIIRRLTRDLHMSVAVHSVPTVRELDGLAMSSRNGYLSPRERSAAPALYDSLCRARDMIAGGDRDYAAIEATAWQWLEPEGFAVDYFTVRRAVDLKPPGEADTDLIVLAAATLGRARLIDNVRVVVGAEGPARARP